MVVYFSGTGNSKYVAERIAGSLQEKLICMNERIKSGDTGSVKTGENLVVVVPTYAWRIPRVVSDWIGQTEFGRGEECLVCDELRKRYWWRRYIQSKTE